MKNYRVVFRYVILLLSVSVMFAGHCEAKSQHQLLKHKSIDRIVAVVNNDIITEVELLKAMESMRKQLTASQIPLPEAHELRKAVLKKLILEHLQLTLAKKNNIKISDKDVKNVMYHLAERNHMTFAQFERSLEELHFDLKVYRENLRKQILISRLQERVIGPRVHVDEKAIRLVMHEYKKRHLHQEVEYRVWDWIAPLPEHPTAAQVRTAKHSAELMLKRLKAGETIEKYLSRTHKTHSDDADLESGGDLGWRNALALPELFVKDVKKLKKGEAQGPIRAANGFHVIQLLGKRYKGDVKPLSREQAHRLAYEQAFAHALQAWLKELQNAAYIKTL